MQETIKLLSQQELIMLFEQFELKNPNPKPELIAPNEYCLLVSVVLSAQATDKSVNKATESLYKIVQTPQQMLNLGKQNLIEYIRSIGLYNAKAQNIILLSQKLITEFNSHIPSTLEELMSLPGVGRKTANVILNIVYKKPTMPVDTHLLRVCPKIGVAEGVTPLQVEQSLLQRVPEQYKLNAHHWLLLHGRYTCTAKNPKCDICEIKHICKHNKVIC